MGPRPSAQGAGAIGRSARTAPGDGIPASGRLINPAHPAVLDFVDRIAARADTWA
ncbi:hypothetical protein SRABI83_00799 [Arthrobacter sp. Bi83]|uniref:hypothetical protein n=1 Tax=Arthrobacter sp. Bi83 TaxID=2822353 RepID=UPI001DEB49BE|nr:hypothetical protein [Arthrobacter sp. Bi83]CAH0154568.1 hypothetical protein SRABI83_00799 [Arthrobacter sp. Bi83]